MSTFFKNFLENDSPISIQKIASSLFAIVMLRTFLELFSNRDNNGLIFGWETTYAHFPLFYFSIFLSFSLILHFLTKETFTRIWNFLLPIFFLIILPPIIDLLATNGKGEAISYIATQPQNIIPTLFKFLYFSKQSGITSGIQITAFTILLSLFLFILYKTKNLFKAAFGVAAGYIILFICAIIPSITAMPYLIFGDSNSANKIYDTALNQGLLQTTRQAMPLSLASVDQQNFLHAIFMSQVFWLFMVIQLFIIFIALNPKYLKMLKENFPVTRIIYWSIIALGGIFISQKMYPTIDIKNITTLVSFCVIFWLGVLNTILAICINDDEDKNIDIISNPNRPLVNKTLSSKEWRNLITVLLFLIIIGLATMNKTMTFFFVFTQMIYYAYSAHPLRLKRNFISSTIAIGLASTGVAMAGFFFASADQHLSAFPLKAIYLIAISFGLLSNMKDIKDYAGDKKEGIQTMPVFFGLENSKKIIAVVYAVVFISLPLILQIHSITYFSILCSIFVYYLFTKKQYQEKYIFLVLFFYAAMLFVTML